MDQAVQYFIEFYDLSEAPKRWTRTNVVFMTPEAALAEKKRLDILPAIAECRIVKVTTEEFTGGIPDKELYRFETFTVDRTRTHAGQEYWVDTQEAALDECEQHKEYDTLLDALQEFHLYEPTGKTRYRVRRNLHETIFLKDKTGTKKL